MSSTTRYALIAVALVILGFAAFAVNANYTNQGERTGTEQLSAEEVVDLEVEAAAQFKASGGKYE